MTLQSAHAKTVDIVIAGRIEKQGPRQGSAVIIIATKYFNSTSAGGAIVQLLFASAYR